MQELIAFIETPALGEKRRMVEAQSAFLSDEADAWLVQLAAAQPDEGVRQVVEAHRALLARCREVGIGAAFEEVGESTAQTQEAAFEQLLNELCDEVVTLLIEGDAAQRADLADSLTVLAAQPLPIEGAETFAALLAAWLRGEPTDDAAAALPSPFREAYEQMADAIAEAEEEEAGEEDEVLSLLAVVAALLTQGTATERTQMATHLEGMQAEAAEEDGALATFVGCLRAALRGEPAASENLEAPYTDLWSILQQAVAEEAETGEDE